MSTDEDLTAMLRNSVPDDDLRSFDPTELAAVAARRRARRRTVLLAGIAVAAIGIGGPALLGPETPSPQPTGDAAMPSNTPTPTPRGLRPSCGGLAIRITGNPELGALYELSAKAGTEVAIEAEVLTRPDETLLEGALLVGRPGTVLGRPANAGRPNPPNAIALPENQRARQRLIQGEPVTLRFTPTSPGDYAVYFEATVQTNGHDCRPMSGRGQLAIVHVTQ